MKNISLFVKPKNKRQLNQTKKILYSIFNDIDVEIEFLGKIPSGWLNLSIEGEDEQIAINYLIKEIGICPETLANIEKDNNLNGRIADFYKNEILLIDIGIFKPKIQLCSISIDKLLDQLSINRKITLVQLARLYGLVKELPIQIKIEEIDEAKNFILAKLSEKQINSFNLWKRSLLDRLILQGITHKEAKKAISISGLSRDVIDIKQLSLFTQVLTCKLGTQGVGLIPKLGKLLKAAKITVFNPKKLFSNNKKFAKFVL